MNRLFVPSSLYEIAVSWTLPSDRLEALDALGLEDLDSVGFELIISCKAYVQTHDQLGLLVGHGTDEFEG